MENRAHISTAFAQVDLSALRANARKLVAEADPAGVMAVVKADAYGHGAVPVTLALLEEGISWFAVATVGEGIELRAAGITEPILVMGALLPEAVPVYLEHRLDATIGSEQGLAAVLAYEGTDVLRVHLKMDTGMGRVGLAPVRARSAISEIRSTPGVRLVGVSSHFSSADEDDLAFTSSQISRFRTSLEDVDLSDVIVHMENTEGLARSRFPASEFGHVLVRLGIGMYGCPIRLDTRVSLGLEPVMTLTAQITNIKEVEPGTPISYNRRWTAKRRTHVATVGIGYADGYPRSLRGKAEVGIADHRCPVVGTICMDMIMVDLGPERPIVSVGDEVVLFGRGGPDVSEIAKWANTITYEVVCGLGRRIRRRFA